MTAVSPLLDGADRAAAWFDWRQGAGNRTSGCWVTTVKRGSESEKTHHQTQAAAWAYIGLGGGSQDPEYQPRMGDTESKVAVG